MVATVHDKLVLDVPASGAFFRIGDATDPTFVRELTADRKIESIICASIAVQLVVTTRRGLESSAWRQCGILQ
jgi:hypothetical protein